MAYQLDSHEAGDPRDLRGIALDPSGSHLYLGYNNMNWSGEGPSHRVALDGGLVTHSRQHRGKSIAVDDQGRVYIARGAEIYVLDEYMNLIYLVSYGSNMEGLMVHREAGELALYASDRGLGSVYRWSLEETGPMITGHLLAGLDGDGILDTPTGCRGIALAPDGRLVLANPGGNSILTMNPDGSGLDTFTLPGQNFNPYYLIFLGNQLIASNGYYNNLLCIDYPSMSLQEIHTPDWIALGVIEPIDWQQSITGICGDGTGQGFYFALEHGDMGVPGNETGWEPVIHASLGSQTVEALELPDQFNLLANAPNPFNPTTLLRFELAQTGQVQLSIFDLLGRELDRPLSGLLEAGFHELSWDAGNMNSGVYIMRLETETGSQSRRMTLLR